MTKKYWNNIYKKNKQISEWPWPEVIKYYRTYIPPKKTTKVLELGFGSGANIPFFIKNNINYFGIEVSKNIFNKVKKKYNFNQKKVFNYNFKDFNFKNNFDLIFDRCAICYNKENDIKKIIQNIYKNLLPGGYYFGIDWACTDTINVKKPIYKKFFSGPYSNQGPVFFSNKEKIIKLFSNFKLIELNKNIRKDLLHKKKYVTLSFVAKKIK